MLSGAFWGIGWVRTSRAPLRACGGAAPPGGRRQSRRQLKGGREDKPLPLFLPGSAAALVGPACTPTFPLLFPGVYLIFQSRELTPAARDVEEGQEGWDYTGSHAKWRLGAGTDPWSGLCRWVLPQVKAPAPVSPPAPHLLPPCVFLFNSEFLAPQPCCSPAQVLGFSFRQRKAFLNHHALGHAPRMPSTPTGWCGTF